MAGWKVGIGVPGAIKFAPVKYWDLGSSGWKIPPCIMVRTFWKARTGANARSLENTESVPLIAEACLPSSRLCSRGISALALQESPVTFIAWEVRSLSDEPSMFLRIMVVSEQEIGLLSHAPSFFKSGAG